MSSVGLELATPEFQHLVHSCTIRNSFGKSVSGSNIHDIEMWFFHSLWIMFLETLRRFDLSSGSLGHVMFSFAGTAQEAGAGGRWTVNRDTSCPRSTTGSCFLSSSREGKHHVTKASGVMCRWYVWFCIEMLSALCPQNTTVSIYYNSKTYVVKETCSDTNVGKAERILFAWYQLIIMFVLPMSVMVYCYAYVIHVLWASTRNLANMTRSER